ncbi:MAG: hypothetical protein ACPHYF_05065 [Akkermansiaceae bacterium]
MEQSAHSGALRKVAGMLCWVWGMVITIMLCADDAHAQSKPDYELAPVQYSKSRDRNAITDIQAAMAAGSVQLSGESPKEVLHSLLDRLGVPVSSQVLVFSKTSLQRGMISPTNPRAIYFNDDFYVGYVPGGLIEVIACDDPTGMMFYSFNANQAGEKHGFVRDQQCLSCHASSNTMNTPGLLVRSVFTEKDGQTVLSWGSSLTTPASPLPDRWGGWYVTGSHGNSRHMGNKWVTRSESGQLGYDAGRGHNVSDLGAYFDTRKHLRDTSDILALMIMEHQIEVHNTLSAVNMGYRRSLYLNKAIRGSEQNVVSPARQKQIRGYVDLVLKVLLFADEVRLPEDGIQGSAAYQESFTGQGVRYDGRSLRDLRLEKRLFKYRCSYMIHSKAFAHLPEEIKTGVLEKLHSLLTGDANFEDLPSLSSREKERIHDILSHTHKAYQEVMTR